MLQSVIAGGGTFRDVDRILEGLSYEMATARVPGAAHSIYELLWHVELSQRLLLTVATGGTVDWHAVDAWWPEGESETEFTRVLRDLNLGLAQAQVLAGDPSDLARDALTDLAVHGAYHWGQVVQLRRQLGDWSMA